MEQKSRIFLLALTMALVLSGCGGQKSRESEKGELVQAEIGGDFPSLRYFCA